MGVGQLPHNCDTQMSTLERIVGLLVTPGILTWLLTSYAGVLTFFLKSFDRRIRALETGKADVTDLTNLQALLQQLIESQDRRTARMEGLVTNLMSYSETFSQLPRRNSEDINNLATVVRELVSDINQTNRVLEKIKREG